MIDEHFQTMFSMALGISEPWFISDITMEQSEKEPTRMEMHISVNYAEGSKFQYPGEAEAASVYDTHEKTWRHMNFFQYRCYITARVPRVKLSNGKIKTVEVPWGRIGSGFTLMM